MQQHAGSWEAAQNSHDRGSILGVSERLIDLQILLLVFNSVSSPLLYIIEAVFGKHSTGKAIFLLS